MADVVKIGLLGCGTVGGALVALIAQRRSAIEHITGITLEIVQVAVRSASRERSCELNPDVVTTDASQVVTAPDVDLVVEVIGGIEPARSLILDALAAGKPVVTANKELLANCGAELYAAAESAGVDLLFEAAAAGAIPIVRPLRESLLAEDVTRVMGIVNGTTNFILTKMAHEGSSYSDALTEAQELGYAERDPTADVEGFDAGAKAAIMAGISFGARVVAGDVYHEGISAITAADINYAKRLGYAIKLLAIAEKFGTDADGAAEVGVRVHPTMVPIDHPLASVNGSFNAVFVEGAAAGELMFYGRGAGGAPTASAVLGDVVDAAINLRRNSYRSVPAGPKAKIRPIDQLESAYYLNLEVEDSPGVLSQVAGVIGQHGLSIESMEQQGTGDGARLVFITHSAAEQTIQAALHELKKTPVVKGVAGFLRVLGE
jgi:homoserine dehydrogenase